MSDLNDLLSRLPISDIAGQLGVDDKIAMAASAQALPALLGGLAAQTQDEGTAQGLVSALAKHGGGLSEGTINFSEVDTADGEKIVTKVFGGETDTVANQLAGASPAAAVDSGLIKKVLPILAPIVLSLITSKILGNKTAGAGTSANAGAGDLGSILGGALGGNAAGGLGSILGGLLGGGAGGSSGGLGSILGNVLGGGK